MEQNFLNKEKLIDTTRALGTGDKVLLAIDEGNKEANIIKAQQALLYRANCNRSACRSKYNNAMETYV